MVWAVVCVDVHVNKCGVLCKDVHVVAALPALASVEGGGVGRSMGVIRFCDEVGSFFYNGDMQNLKTVLTG